jgi:hypothetical protein
MINISGDLSDLGYGITIPWLKQNGYTIAHTGCSLKYDLESDFIAALQLEGFSVCDLREFDHSITAWSADRTIYVRTCNLTDIYTNKQDHSIIVTFFNKFKKYFNTEDRDNPEKVNVEYYYRVPSGTRSSTITIEKKKIQQTLPELYPDYDVAELVRQYLASPDSILILYGPPGVGKTQFIRYIMKQGTFHDITYVKDQHVLQASDFWAEMSSRDIDLMIFDDMDEGLKPRKKQKDTDFASNLLSFTSGIFDKNTKIIITTNQEINEIDGAIVRPGRCFDFLTLHPLSYAQAKDVWISVLGQPQADFERLYAGQKTVTQASLMSDFNREKNNFTERSYVKTGNKNYNVQSKLQANGVIVY